MEGTKNRHKGQPIFGVLLTDKRTKEFLGTLAEISKQLLGFKGVISSVQFFPFFSNFYVEQHILHRVLFLNLMKPPAHSQKLCFLKRLHILQFVNKHPGSLMTCRERLLLHYIKDLQSQAWTSIVHTIHCFLLAAIMAK